MASAWGSSWGAAWGNSWGQVSRPLAQVSGYTIETPSYYSLVKEAHMRQLREEDEILLAILQMFVIEEA